MKVSFIRVNTDLLIGKKHDIVTNYLAQKFLGLGVVLHNLLTIQNNPDSMFQALNFIQSDIVFIVGETSSAKNYGIKKAIATHLGLQLEENEICVSQVQNFFANEQVEMIDGANNEYFIPESAVPLSVKLTYMQGFMLTHNNKLYVFLPDNIEFVQTIYENVLQEVLLEHSNIKYVNYIIKTFGIYEKDIYKNLSDLLHNEHKILFITYPTELETTLLIRYNEELDEDIVRDFLAQVVSRLQKYVYADEDVSLATRAMELLKISKKTVAVAESVSGGNIASTLFKQNLDASTLVKEAIVCPNEESKINRLGVSQTLLEKYGEVSVEVAYEMAAGLLETSRADYVLCTTGMSESLKPTDKKVTFIAVGNEDGIHVYKNTFIGTKERVIENITQSSLFYLIKNIRQNDLLLGETVV